MLDKYANLTFRRALVKDEFMSPKPCYYIATSTPAKQKPYFFEIKDTNNFFQAKFLKITQKL